MQFRILGPIQARARRRAGRARRAEAARPARAAARQPPARRDGRAAHRRALGRGSARVGRPVAAGLRPRAAPRARRGADRDRRPRLPRRRRRGRARPRPLRAHARARPGRSRSGPPGRRGGRPARGARGLARAGARRPAGGDRGAPPRPSASRSCGSARSSFATTRSSRCGRHDAVVAELEASRRSTRTASGSSSSGCSRSTAATARPRRSRSYREAREVLAEDLGLDPSPALQELERAILRQDPSLAAPEAPTRSTRPLPVPPTPLVGRRLELGGGQRAVPRRGRAARHAHRPGRDGQDAARARGRARARARAPRRRRVRQPRAASRTRSCSCRRSPKRSRCRGEHAWSRRRSMHLRSDGCCSCWTTSSSSSPPRRSSASCSPRHHASGSSPRAARRCGSRPSTSTRCRRSTLPTPDLPFEALVKTDAVRLFAARAQAVDPGFELDTGSAPEVAHVCARLDGLPLAIELAAARAKLLAPAEILERLEREPNLLPSGTARRARTPADTRRHDPLELRPARPGRAAGVRAARRLRRRLHARRPPSDMCDVTLESLAALVDNNLLRRRDGRFMMLETVRHFAVERLEEPGSAETAAAARGVADRARRDSRGRERWSSEDVWLDRVQPEHDNIRAALAWSLADGIRSWRCGFELRSGSSGRCAATSGKGGNWIEQALPPRRSASPRVRMKALSVGGAIATRRGDRGPGAESARKRPSSSHGSSGTTSGSRAYSQRSRHRGGDERTTWIPRARCWRRAPRSSASSTSPAGSRPP